MKNPLITALLLLSIQTYAQDKIETDRPSESVSPEIVSKNTFQVETGIRKEQDGEDKVWQQPTILARFGLFKRVELRLNGSIEKQTLASENIYRNGLTPVEPGIKVRIFESTDKSFSTSIIGHAGIPGLSSDDHDIKKMFHRVRLLLENQLSDKIKLTYNAGSDWDSKEEQQNWVYTVSPGWEITDKWETFVEVYGFAHKGKKPEHVIDMGMSYFISSDAKIDLSGGIGLTPASPDYFFAGGLSFRLKTKKD